CRCARSCQFSRNQNWFTAMKLRRSDAAAGEFSPHGEEARSAVSNHEATGGSLGDLLLRDARVAGSSG
ncbi:hypothetical protein U6J50_12215, partial [Cutibacterium acnes]